MTQAQAENVYLGIRAGSVFILGLFVLKIVLRVIQKSLSAKMTPQNLTVVNKILNYAGMILIILMSFRSAGIEISVLLGAAGVMGVAIGFAAKTSISNLISGVFLMIDRPFHLGDTIELDGIVGKVVSIDLLSTKVLKFDNKLMRIPNESVFNCNIANYTHSDKRRLDLTVGVSYDADIDHVIATLSDCVDKNLYCLKNPEVTIRLDGLGASSLDFFIGVWHMNDQLGDLKKTLLKEIKNRLDKENIEIPYPHMTLCAGKSLTVTTNKG